ncbi:hypothetical protein CSA37_05250 [Candidatus Fermentibacteria bacterium]|nr:MAG: hypothetical protein CSA37_05250 [Candidatus Fermentibacteria bacterium]
MICINIVDISLAEYCFSMVLSVITMADYVPEKHKSSNGGLMKIATALLVTVTASASLALTALPTAGYSSSTGLILGGFLITDSQFSLDGYYGTAGVIKFQPSYTAELKNGIISTELEYRKMLKKKWFGWGNDTDGDSTATMDIEMFHLTGSYTAPITEELLITAGLDARHSTVYNMESSPLWSMMQGREFNPVLTIGPMLKLTLIRQAPMNGEALLETGGFFQTGDVSYGGFASRGRLTLKPWNGGETALGARYYRHFGVEQTPVPYTSSLGSQTDFRGYSDYRFTGEAWLIGQFEVRQTLLTLTDSENISRFSFGFAAFAEAGRTAVKASELTLENLHTDIGGGIRIGTGQDAKMRIDAAWGDEGMKISAGFDSAF